MLFTPFAVGAAAITNRLVALPVFTGYALPDGRASAVLLRHYAALAETGVAMVVVANAAVAANGVVAINNRRVDRNDFIPDLARLAEAIRTRGAAAVLQLNHGGRFAKTAQPLSSAAIDAAPIPFDLERLKEFMNFFPLERRFGLTRDFLERLAAWRRSMAVGRPGELVSAFADAAARACEAGFDAVGLHGATGYLLTQYLCGFYHRDAAGRPLDFEARVVLERGFVCALWPRAQQERVDLEQRLRRRDLYRSLWVVAGMRDLHALRGPAAAAPIPARAASRLTLLFLKAAEAGPEFDAAAEDFTAWCRRQWVRHRRARHGGDGETGSHPHQAPRPGKRPGRRASRARHPEPGADRLTAA